MELPTGNVTLLLTDIEGSTRRWENNSRQMNGVVKRHDEILIAIIESHGGCDLRKKGEGDSHFAVFSSASSALCAAVDIHNALQTEDWGEVGSIYVRCALHSGEAELRDNDYYGQVVNRCARLRGVAHGGQTIISDTTRLLIGSSLPFGGSLNDLGMHRLKDLLEPEHIYQVNAPGLLDEFPPLTSLSAAKHNLPVQLSSFVGREIQLETIKRLVFSKRLVTLRGAGGSGKTRLALQIGAEVVDDFPGGVWFIPLVGLQDLQLVAHSVAESLPISVKGRDPVEAIVDSFLETRALFIVDNCEHLGRGPSEVINRLLRACPKVVILATSREPLNVSGESDYEVPTMSCDLRGEDVNVDSVAKLEAIELVRERAKNRLSDQDILTKDTAADLAALVKKLDGLPLALEQAAANFAHSSPREVLQKLEAHFDSLQSDDIDVDPRHRTITATIDWSHSRLSEQEQHVFASLSIFAGGWTKDAAELICGSDVVDAKHVGAQIENLVKKSLVISERLDGWKVNRYRMLQPIREYSAAKRETGEYASLQEKHFRWYSELANQAEAAGLEADDNRYTKWLTADLDNLRAGMKWAIEFDPLLAVRCSVAMYRFWLDCGHIREGSVWIQSALDAAINLPAESRAESLIILGILVWRAGNLDAADRALRASKEIFEDIGNRDGIARANGNLGNLAFTRNDFQESVEGYRQALDVIREGGNQDRLAATLENLGVAEGKIGGLDEAQAHLEEAVRIRRKVGHKARTAKAIDSLLGVYGLQERLNQYLWLFIECAEMALESQDKYTIENALDVAIPYCTQAQEYSLAVQALAAMEKAVEESERSLTPIMQEERESQRLSLMEKMNPKDFKAAWREGRALGAESVLRFIVACLSG